MYGPSLYISDFNLGIFYMLAVSSIATYGILLAGSEFYEGCTLILLREKFSYYINLNISSNNLYRLVFRCIVFSCLFLFLASFFALYFKELFLFSGVGKTNIDQIEFIFGAVSLKSLKTTDSYASNTIKSLHSPFIKELYKDRKAPVIPFNEKSVLTTCYNILDKTIRSELLKEWGSKSCIYLIAYKHDPLIYYIGRTSLFKRRLNNHLKADAGTKLQLFLSLVGWEHFNLSVIEECLPDNQGSRENYYLQKYLPLLNSAYSSSITESAISLTLKNKKIELLKAGSIFFCDVCILTQKKRE